MRFIPGVAVALYAVLVVGCSVETSGLLATGAPDGGDAREDVGLRDARAVDSGDDDSGSAARDSGLPDVGPADSAPPDAGRPSCTDLYGGTNGYYLCEERDGECMFYARLEGLSCDEACAAGTVPGTCTGNEGNSSATGPDRCTPTGREFTCNDGYTDHICICSRPS